MAKRKLTFEGVVDPGSSYKLIGQYAGFNWNQFAAIDDASQVTGSGTAVARQTSPGALSSFYDTDGDTFGFRKAKFIDVGDNDFGDTIWIRGYQDGALVAETFVFLQGAAPRVEKLGAAFRQVDFVSFVGNTSSWAFDDLIVRTPPVPPDAPLG